MQLLLQTVDDADTFCTVELLLQTVDDADILCTVIVTNCCRLCTFIQIYCHKLLMQADRLLQLLSQNADESRLYVVIAMPVFQFLVVNLKAQIES